MKNLFRAIAQIENEKQCAAFLRDLCTISELNEMAKRWEAVRLLDRKTPVREIAAKTGLSTATVCRVSQWLRFGAGGYRQILEKSK